MVILTPRMLNLLYKRHEDDESLNRWTATYLRDERSSYIIFKAKTLDRLKEKIQEIHNQRMAILLKID